MKYNPNRIGRQGLVSKKDVLRILNGGGVGVLPTDTLYGIVGSALSKKTVARIYKLRKRDPKKPCIILIGSVADVQMFGVQLEPRTSNILHKYWPGKVSIILPISHKSFITGQKYLHRGTNALAFRLPAKKSLRNLLVETGPIVAPSANPEGKPPARTVAEAKRYFGDRIDFYVDGGRILSKPSIILRIRNGRVSAIRP